MSDRAPSLSDLAYDRLTHLITRCVLAPGEWVTERQLADMTGLGLGPVRSAMARLRHDGLLIAVRRVGYRVTPITIDDVTDLFDTWAIVAPAIVELAFRRASDEQIDEFEAKARELSRRIENGEEHESELGELWFGLLLGMTGSKRLADIYERLHIDVARCFFVASAQGATLTGDAWAVRETIDLLRRRDHEAGAARARAVVETTRRLVLRVLHASPGIADAELRFPMPSA